MEWQVPIDKARQGLCDVPKRVKSTLKKEKAITLHQSDIES